MRFDWDPDTQALVAAGRAFAARHLGRGERRPTFDRTRWDACAAQGLTGLSLPEALGGAGLGAVTTAAVLEAVAAETDDLGLLFALGAHQFACAQPIAAFGDEALRADLVPALASGQRIAANGMTEAEAGSDTRRLATRARRDGDDYVLDGTKVYVTNAPVADVFVVYATSRPEHGFMGQSAFVVHRSNPGVRVGETMQKVGLHGAPTASIYLDECRVPVRHRLGAEGDGAKVFRHSMAWERACLFAIYVGGMQRQMDALTAFAKSRRQGRAPISKFQAISHRLANMRVRIESARLLLYRACWLHDEGRPAEDAIAMAKLAVSEAAVQTGLDAIQISGGAGVMLDTGISRGLEDALASTIFSGTSEIQRNLIARGMGL